MLFGGRMKKLKEKSFRISNKGLGKNGDQPSPHRAGRALRTYPAPT